MEYLQQKYPSPGAFLPQYQGEIATDEKEVERREQRYKRESSGCFMYFFKCIIQPCDNYIFLVFSGSNL